MILISNEELERYLMASVEIKLRNKTGSTYESIEGLCLEYMTLFPNDTIGNNILSNLIRKRNLGLSVLDGLEFIDKHLDN